ncbi:MAG: glycosyltransferase [Candidatus Thermoplasmatota archaeon]|nr:glycosyltransferase [Candidatus Thermoplasmatota archaeon]
MKHRSEPERSEALTKDDVTVLVPVFKEKVEVFDRVIQRIVAQGTRFVVVGDSSDEPYRSIVEKNGGIFILLKERKGKRIAISEGMKYVDTRFVLFVDSGTAIPVDTL